MAQTSQPENPIAAPGATLQRLPHDFSFTEGPAADKDGNIFFTDQPNDSIWKYDTDGNLSLWMKPAGRANGLCFDNAGNLIACADNKNELWSISPDKQITVLLKDNAGKLLNGPNDIWVIPEGGPIAGMYITDPFYKRDYWSRGSKEYGGEFVFFLSPDAGGGKNLKPVATDLQQPNGIVGTPDGKNLYVADIKAKKTYSYSIQPDGSLADKKLFCNLGSDGMTIDSDGNLYLTGNGVTIFDKTGKQIGHININEKWTANICFGGKDKSTLFITASKSAYTLQTKVHGVGSE
jgi:gluconolactonase